MLKPILFNTEMVRAILDGRKTVTRRLIKDKDIIYGWDCEADGTPIAWIDHATGDSFPPTESCRLKVGDILYVRETWGQTADLPGISEEATVYAADFSDRELAHLKDKHFRWRPSIHMPKELARLYLRVTSVRAERLRSITIGDAYAEGVRNTVDFPKLWDSTVPKAELDTYGWKANPWVWVIRFELCEKPEG